MSAIKILVTGSNGQLGSELKDLSVNFPQLQFHFFSRKELPLEDAEAINKIIKNIQPQYVVNCAAYTAVDKAETEKELAKQVNGTAVGWLAAATVAVGGRFIHISTDYVFDGNANEPLKEDHPTAPVNFYGQTKLAGELAAFNAAPESIVIRTSWVYSYHGKNFVKTMLRLMAERDAIQVVEDQQGTPTYAADLATAILHIITAAEWRPGIYHFSNSGNTTWAGFAAEIARQTSSPCKVQGIPTTQFPTPAKRPHYAVLDKTKIVTTFGIQLKPWQESLTICLEKLRAAGSA